MRDGDEAVKWVEVALRQASRRDPTLLDTAAAAYAEAGRFAQAVDLAQEALAGAEQAKDRVLIAKLQARLQLYRSGKPVRQGQ